MKAKRGKCLALVAVLAMVVCAFAIAVPSGDSDAAVSTESIEGGAPTRLTGEATVGNGVYYVDTPGIKVTVSTANATIYLVGSGSIKLTTNVLVAVKLAVDNGGSAPTKCYSGLDIKISSATAGSTANVSVKDGAIQTSLSLDRTEASTFGISTTTTGTDGTTTYYPEGSKVDFNLTATAKSITIRNGTSTVTQGSNTLKAVDVDGDLTITYDATIPTLSGSVTDGSATVTGGYFSAAAAVDGINAVAVYSEEALTTLKCYMSAVLAVDTAITATPYYKVVGEVTQKTSYTPKTTATPAADAPVAVTVDTDATLIIQKGVTLNANVTATDGTLKVFGTLVSDDSETTGNIFIGPEGFVKTKTTNVTITGNTNVTSGEDTEIFGDVSGILQTSVIGEKGGKKTLTVPEGQTLTLNGDLGLNGGILYVSGTLVIGEKASIYGTNAAALAVDSEKIVLGPNGKIVNNGKIAVNYPIVIADSNAAAKTDSTDGARAITIQGVTGAEFSYVSGTLSVAGNIQAMKSTAGASEVTLTYADIAGDLTIGNGVTFTKAADVLTIPKGATVTVDGALSASPTLMEGAKLIVNGTIDKTTAETITVKIGTYGDTDNTLTYDTTGVTITVSTDKVTGFTVCSKKVIETSGVFLKAFISGTIADGDTTATTAATPSIAISGDITVAAGETLTVKSDVTIGSVTKVIVLGKIVADKGTDIFDSKYIGAFYVLSSTNSSGNPVSTGYYEPIAKAMAEIDNAKDKTVTIIVKNLDENITVGNGQTVNLTVSNDVKGIVGADAVVKYDAGSKGTITIDKVEGKVVISGTSNATEAITEYDSLKTDSDNTKTYSGFAVALKEANPGDVIEIGSATVNGSVTIPAGVTVKVTDKLTINGNLTIPETAKLVGGTIEMKGATREVNVQGELDLSNGTITAASTTPASGFTVTSTGKTVLQTKPTNANGAYYTDIAGNYILTSVAKAVAYANENESVNSIEVVGTYTETAPVTLDGVNMKVTGSSITLGDVTLVEGTKITATGTLTANVISKSGAGAEAAVKLTKASATLESKKVTSAAGADTYTFTVTGLKGEMNVTKGTVSVPGETLAGKLTVDSGAELLIDKGVTFEVSSSVTAAALTVNGTATVKGDLVIAKAVTVAGTLAVEGTVTVSASANLKVTGTVTVGTDGKFNVNGRVDVGTAATTLGAVASIVGEVTFPDSSAGYIVAYPGSDLSKAVMPETVKTTKFHVNDTLFATAYTMSGTVRNASAVTYTTLNAIVGFVDISAVKWLDSNGAEATYVGDKADVYVTLKASEVSVSVSSGSGLSLWVDGVKYNSGSVVKLTVGEHQVQVTVNPGYKGDAAVTFNGASVTDGKIVVTADMVGGTSIVLSAAGNISVDTGDSGSGSSIAEILLIVLVVLAAVLVVLVALRMMRS